MLGELYRTLLPEGVKIVLVLFLSFLLGLEREEHKTSGAEYAFGGVRTFPLIGLIGYTIAFLSQDQLLPVTLGLEVTQVAGGATPLASAATAILIAASSNNVVKGFYAYALSDRKTGMMSLALLLVLAVAGLVPLVWVWGV